jgi:uncharacterized protein (DUF433 family)
MVMGSLFKLASFRIWSVVQLNRVSSVFPALNSMRKGPMTMNARVELLKRIEIDPLVCFGRPVIRGTRIWVSLIVDNLAEGVSEAELLAAYPQLRQEDIHAALAYAAEMTRERIIPIPTEPAPV